MRNHLAPVSLFVLSSIAALGCDASALPGVASSSDASAGISAVLRALRGNNPEALHIDNGPSSFREVDLDGVGGAVDVSSPCAGGGTVAFAGELSITGSAGADASDFDPFNPDQDDIEVHIPEVNFDYTVTFDGCTEDGVTIDGEMTWSLESSWDSEALELSMSWAFLGGVDFTGAATGHCDFDFQGSASSAEEEGWTEVDLDAAEGSACGFEAGEVLDEEGE
ncbi:MAG: hypothetical protein AAF721_16530 [Myxococcota bacterium]